MVAHYQAELFISLNSKAYVLMNPLQEKHILVM